MFMNKIGITERGDAGLDLSWADKMQRVDGAILITKNVNDRFIETVAKQEKPVIVHGTCTGFGGTELEPNVIPYRKQIEQLVKLSRVLSPEKIVLRIDPIFPTEAGLRQFHNVMGECLDILKPEGIRRIRISVFDEYNHVKARFRKKGWEPCYGKNLYASQKQLEAVAKALEVYAEEATFETCAETALTCICSNTEAVGCISERDLIQMRLPVPEDRDRNPQKRRGCLCLYGKTELLTNKRQCPHKCVYCYWKDETSD